LALLIDLKDFNYNWPCWWHDWN